MMILRKLALLITLSITLVACASPTGAPVSTVTPTATPIPKVAPTATMIPVPTIEPSEAPTVELTFPSDRFPETSAHIVNAIANGASAICTIDRDGADDNRSASLAGIPTKKGYDRDEWPMAMCAEGGEGADIEYVTPKDNRGAGSWVGNQLEDYADGTKVLFVMDAPVTAEVAETTPELTEEPAEVETVYYANCTAVREAGAAPIRDGDPGYSTKLDRDGDGIGCE